MTLQTNLNQTEVTLKLLQNGRVIDFQTAKYYHELSDVLITSLDKLLKRNRVDVKALKSYKMLSGLGKDSTSYKIALTFLESLKVQL